MTTTEVTQGNTMTPLHADLLALLHAMRRAERSIFAGLSPSVRDAPGTIGAWSAKDAQAHLAAWRSIEARRLEATVAGGELPSSDPAPDAPVDEANAHIHEQRAGLGWDAVEREADDSVAALAAAIERSSFDALCVCEGTTASIGANGVNHAIAHLSDVARLGASKADFDEFAREVEAILGRGHLPVRDSGVMLYNLACHAALSGDLEDARRLLADAIERRHDLAEVAREDPDLAALGPQARGVTA
ncbi:MAG TPA: hypothetical protein VHK28_00370 [Candidatus Limnocylindria bacterium]|nr:hypothetical protein [Candidatus Limnocylindria bacterium]